MICKRRRFLIRLSLIHISEVLLNYAEAVFERDGQISDEDLAISLNLTRKLINPEMPDLTNDFVTANNLDMRTEIRRERTIEFFDENLKRFFFIYIKFKTNIYTIYSNIRYTVGYTHGFLSD